MRFARLLARIITEGELTLVDAAGVTHRMGRAGGRPAVTVRLRDRSLHRRLLLDPRLAVGEAYMEGSLTVEAGSLADFLELLCRNLGDGTAGAIDRWIGRARMAWRHLTQLNTPRQARRNVAHHYDLTGALYDLFLDRDRQYSCAYFLDPDDGLDRAQMLKKRHIAAKLLLEPGMKVLDIGSGWGGLALSLADWADVEVTGITLSEEQRGASTARAEERGLAGRVQFVLRDYRDQTGPFDRIVSVGMLEHVGAPNYRTFFGKVADCLADDGVALIHTISHRDGPYPTNPWLSKYIFPGGYSPSLSELLPAIERAGLWVTDVEILRLHYAETLRRWRQRFLSNWDAAATLYDERFCRMWEFYLAGCEMAFRHQGHMVAQIQLAKSVDAVPLTRDYIAAWEDRFPLETDVFAAHGRKSGRR